MGLFKAAGDEVVPLAEVPDQSPGSPLPVVVADDWRLLLAYRLAEGEDDFMAEDRYAIVRFRSPRAHALGPPNDETLHAHPLAARGLEPYSAYEVHQSSWVRRIARLNSAHPRHDPERFKGLRHFVFTFHDSFFECIATGLDWRVWEGRERELLPQIVQELAR